MPQVGKKQLHLVGFVALALFGGMAALQALDALSIGDPKLAGVWAILVVGIVLVPFVSVRCPNRLVVAAVGTGWTIAWSIGGTYGLALASSLPLVLILLFGVMYEAELGRGAGEARSADAEAL
jgi:hypothetical protein